MSSLVCFRSCYSHQRLLSAACFMQQLDHVGFLYFYFYICILNVQSINCFCEPVQIKSKIGQRHFVCWAGVNEIHYMLCIQMRQMIVFCSVDFTIFHANCHSNFSQKIPGKRYRQITSHHSPEKVIQRYIQDTCVILHKLNLHLEFQWPDHASY